MKVRLRELREYYQGFTLNKHYKQLIDAKQVDHIIVDIDLFTSEFFPLSDEYLKILIRLLDDVGYWERINTTTKNDNEHLLW
jgi:hypothetical protein